VEEEVIDTDGQVITKTTVYGNIFYCNAKDERHRIGGPAIVYSNGTQAYYVNGKRHRLDGPAVVWGNGRKFYYVDGIDCTEKDYPQAVLKYKLKQLVG
jgi:hypothetical protein